MRQRKTCSFDNCDVMFHAQIETGKKKWRVLYLNTYILTLVSCL
jgi:hypothetical protein